MRKQKFQKRIFKPYTQEELSDRNRDLGFVMNSAEYPASLLKKKKILAKDTKVSDFCVLK